MQTKNIAGLLTLLLCLGFAHAQLPGRGADASLTEAGRKPSSLSSLQEEARIDRELLKDVDVASDIRARNAIYKKWAEATCRIKQLQLEASLGAQGSGASVYSACIDRLLRQEPMLISVSGTTAEARPAEAPVASSTAPSNAVNNNSDDAGTNGSATASGAAQGASLVARSTSDASDDHGTKVVLIGGFEQSGYSSLGLSTNPFVNAFISGGGEKIKGWGRIRLLSAPQPSTQGIVSTFTDPTGQITKLDFSKVGEALDFVAGPEIKIAEHWSFVAGLGATTPLSSQTVTLTYAAPAAGTIECATMVSRFSTKNGYSPGLVAAPSGSSTCLQGGFTDVAFTNQDRSNFFPKYGAGFRTSYLFHCNRTDTCSDSYGILDITFGQDATVTRGLLRGGVLKLDGVLPIKTGNSAWLYLFGSAYMRVQHNRNSAPLILQTASGVTIPSSSVVVLPLQQPNRDFYRLGVGINVNQIFCKLSAASCPNPSAQAQAATK